MSTKPNSRVDALKRAGLAHRAARYLVAATLGLSAGLIAPVQAAGNAPAPAAPAKQSMSPEQKALMQDFQQTRQDLIQTGQKLSAIEKKAYAKNPSLGKQRDALRDSIRKKMTTKGFDAQAKFDELKAMINKIKGESGDKAARKKDIVAFRKAQQEFMARQHKAMQDKDVQKQVADLRKSVRSEMMKIEPKSKALFAKMDKDQKHMQELRSKAMAMHGSVKKASPAE